MTADLPRRLVAEALGTLILVATVVGSGIMAQNLAQGNTAVALLANTLATAAILVVLITIFAPLSGAHFNPIVSAVMTASGQLSKPDFVFYTVVQCLGAMGGAILANILFDLPALQISTNLRTGSGIWLSESVATFLLLGAIFGGLRYAPTHIPWLVSLTILAAYWFTASTSFANPAVTIGRMFSNTFAGIAPVSVLPFMLAQTAGAIAAFFIWGWLFQHKKSA
jgi:glycerol uptake facilitator-like aquaporin